GQPPQVFGDDYPTPDGTCVRDYIHVQDLAYSHAVAAKALLDGKELLPAYNLGSGNGLSVKEIMDTFRQVTGIDFATAVTPRRPGDPARIVADGSAAARDLGWEMRHTVAQMAESAWQARNAA
ncbi:MAG: GDP-mannose 4,6-dehydratase, partial [Propionibacteriaceae bacterium]|nr:GDP-mannose 4,6-dehydratase [Propionibacteriaceae bacterium]